MQKLTTSLYIAVSICLLAGHQSVWGQQQRRTEKWRFQPEIKLRNASLESPNKNFVIPPPWKPHPIFLGSTEIKDLRLTRFYSQENPSQDGGNHVALAAFEDGVRENIGQRLRYPVIPGLRFTIEVWLAFSPFQTQVHPIQSLFDPKTDFKPVKLQIYGFASQTDLGNALLAETPVIDHYQWKKYTLTWEATGRYDYIYFVPGWEGTTFYDGNLHVDNLSIIKVTRIRKTKE
ncbi:MAG TPA: hypothetical protein VI603_02525 [Saprospiraceae bacterium]|nr:hypothetical protein [Saprospiraceae bacterium]